MAVVNDDNKTGTPAHSNTLGIIAIVKVNEYRLQLPCRGTFTMPSKVCRVTNVSCRTAHRAML